MRYPAKPARLPGEVGSETRTVPWDGLSARTAASSTKPVLLAVGDDAGSLRSVGRELGKRYGDDYRVVLEGSAEGGFGRLVEHAAAGDEVALVLVDQLLPETGAKGFLGRVRETYPTAKRAILVDRGDRAAPASVLEAMSLGHVDYYLHKPWGTPDEGFHRTVSELLHDWAKDHLPRFEDIAVVGERWSHRAHELRDLLGRNGVPHTFYSADSREGRELLARIGLDPSRLPVVVLFDGQVLIDPSNADIADACGVNPEMESEGFDLVVIGAGPAGLAAAVYGASEGLDTLVVEGEALGGQAGTSSRIRNYPGFPAGIGGAELASRASEQAWLFGATFAYMTHATRLRREGEDLVVSLSCGNHIRARAAIVATGASYRRLDIPNLEALHGAGVFYGAAVSEAHAMKGRDVYVVGAGNAAGQAAMHLSRYASRVTLVARGESLAASMSGYLITELTAAGNVSVRTNTRVVGGGGDGRLEYLVLEEDGTAETFPADGLFVLIGASPHTGWLPEEVARDDEGYIVTGQDLAGDGRDPGAWPLTRAPLVFETSLPGVFAAGDARHASVKRVASAVGAGAIAVQSVHEYLDIQDRQEHAGGKFYATS